MCIDKYMSTRLFDIVNGATYSSHVIKYNIMLKVYECD